MLSLILLCYSETGGKYYLRSCLKPLADLAQVTQAPDGWTWTAGQPLCYRIGRSRWLATIELDYASGEPTTAKYDKLRLEMKTLESFWAELENYDYPRILSLEILCLYTMRLSAFLSWNIHWGPGGLLDDTFFSPKALIYLLKTIYKAPRLLQIRYMP